MLRNGEAAEGEENTLWFEIPPGAFSLFATQRNEQLISNQTCESPEQEAFVPVHRAAAGLAGAVPQLLGQAMCREQNTRLSSLPHEMNQQHLVKLFFLLFSLFLKVIKINQKFICSSSHLAAKLLCLYSSHPLFCVEPQSLSHA